MQHNKIMLLTMVNNIILNYVVKKELEIIANAVRVIPKI